MEQEQENDRGVTAKIHYLKNFKNSEVVRSQKEANSEVISGDVAADKNCNSIESKIAELKPNIPVYFIRPNAIKRAATFFLERFQTAKHATDVLYSVKSNPDEVVLRHLFNSGVVNFDVASLPEVRLVDRLFGKAVKMYFMHPIKSREAIHDAYFNYGIRDFSLDSLDELKKILEVTGNAKDLGLYVRIAIPNSHAAIDLSGKFGIRPSESLVLMRKTRAAAKRFGVCFHVGSQCMDPIEYRNAISIVKEIVEQSKVRLDVLDVGGGFPSTYPGMTPPDLTGYFNEIFDSVSQLNLDKNSRIWCEPGRALVAESGSLVVRVEARKKNMLYLNDGTYGGLFDAGFPGFIYPARAMRVRSNAPLSFISAPFGFYGPTCDSLDTMKGPFYLPDNIAEGDYIEIGQLGAYSRSIRTEFNGFGHNLQIEVADEPMQSMYRHYEKEDDANESSVNKA